MGLVPRRVGRPNWPAQLIGPMQSSRSTLHTTQSGTRSAWDTPETTMAEPPRASGITGISVGVGLRDEEIRAEFLKDHPVVSATCTGIRSGACSLPSLRCCRAAVRPAARTRQNQGASEATGPTCPASGLTGRWPRSALLDDRGP